MNILILLHSTTGNTRLVARRARAHAERRGHACRVLDIGKPGAEVELEGVDLLGVACPTLYFRPSLVMERAVARLPVPPRPLPAFLLSTAGGDLGANFQILASHLAHKDIVTLGGLLVPFPNNWPVHRAAVAKLRPGEPIADLAIRKAGVSRALLATLWPDLGDVSPKAPENVDAFIDTVLDAAERGRSSRWSWAPRPSELPHGTRPTMMTGKLITAEMMRQATDIRIDEGRCSRCGHCVKVCPVGCLTRDAEDAVPHLGEGCTGCWSCFNRCPDGAIAGWKVAPGVGKYDGPTRRARELFKLETRGRSTAPDDA